LRNEGTALNDGLTAESGGGSRVFCGTQSVGLNVLHCGKMFGASQNNYAAGGAGAISAALMRQFDSSRERGVQYRIAYIRIYA